MVCSVRREHFFSTKSITHYYYDITCEVEQYMTEYIWFLSYAMEEGRKVFLCQISNTNNQ